MKFFINVKIIKKKLQKQKNYFKKMETNMKRFKKIFSLITLIAFLCNTFSYALAPGSMGSSLVAPGIKSIILNKYLKTTNPQAGPGMDSLTPEKFTGEKNPGFSEFDQKQIQRMFGNFYLDPVGESYPREWYQNEFFGGNGNFESIDPKTVSFEDALRRFLQMEAKLSIAFDVEIKRTSYKDYLRNEGNNPAQIKSIMANTIPTIEIVLDTKTQEVKRIEIFEETIALWEVLREYDMLIKDISIDGKKRTASLAWGMFFELMKHEFSDISKETDLPKSTGHLTRDTSLTATSTIKVDENEITDIKGRYAFINKCIYFWFSYSYMFKDTVQFDNKCFKDRGEWFWQITEPQEADSEEDTAKKQELRNEFNTITRTKEDFNIALMICTSINYDYYRNKKVSEWNQKLQQALESDEAGDETRLAFGGREKIKKTPPVEGEKDSVVMHYENVIDQIDVTSKDIFKEISIILTHVLTLTPEQKVEVYKLVIKLQKYPSKHSIIYKILSQIEDLQESQKKEVYKAVIEQDPYLNKWQNVRMILTQTLSLEEIERVDIYKAVIESCKYDDKINNITYILEKAANLKESERVQIYIILFSQSYFNKNKIVSYILKKLSLKLEEKNRLNMYEALISSLEYSNKGENMKTMLEKLSDLTPAQKIDIFKAILKTPNDSMFSCIHTILSHYLSDLTSAQKVDIYKTIASLENYESKQRNISHIIEELSNLEEAQQVDIYKAILNGKYNMKYFYVGNILDKVLSLGSVSDQIDLYEIVINSNDYFQKRINIEKIIEQLSNLEEKKRSDLYEKIIRSKYYKNKESNIIALKNKIGEMSYKYRMKIETVIADFEVPVVFVKEIMDTLRDDQGKISQEQVDQLNKDNSPEYLKDFRIKVANQDEGPGTMRELTDEDIEAIALAAGALQNTKICVLMDVYNHNYPETEVKRIVQRINAKIEERGNKGSIELIATQFDAILRKLANKEDNTKYVYIVNPQNSEQIKSLAEGNPFYTEFLEM